MLCCCSWCLFSLINTYLQGKSRLRTRPVEIITRGGILIDVEDRAQGVYAGEFKRAQTIIRTKLKRGLASLDVKWRKELKTGGNSLLVLQRHMQYAGDRPKDTYVSQPTTCIPPNMTALSGCLSQRAVGNSTCCKPITPDKLIKSKSKITKLWSISLNFKHQHQCHRSFDLLGFDCRFLFNYTSYSAQELYKFYKDITPTKWNCPWWKIRIPTFPSMADKWEGCGCSLV